MVLFKTDASSSYFASLAIKWNKMQTKSIIADLVLPKPNETFASSLDVQIVVDYHSQRYFTRANDDCVLQREAKIT